ncbi:hypothetical protein P8C59_003859 [Phyllachora maydis]|uniref:Uncharacterized protein n=1 Tax=Phyllachora maydis TaxID=1825666 RepID=A0AAD9I132_9PEZI|nr:hypothetical protein P8C59_003859 [Phyllachora maydis]
MADVRGDDRDGDRVLDTAATIASEKPLPSEYDVTLARITEEHEKSMTWQEAVTAEARTILYCIGISGLIIMEGYGLAMITYLYSFQTFRQTFGVKYTTTDGSEFWRLSWLTSGRPF